MKILSFFLFLSLNLFATSMFSNGKCVDDFYTTQNNQLFLKYSNNNNYSQIKFNRANVDFLTNNQNKFEFLNGRCQPIKGQFGMSSFQFNFLMSLTGLITSFLIALSIIIRF